MDNLFQGIRIVEEIFQTKRREYDRNHIGLASQLRFGEESAVWAQRLGSGSERFSGFSENRPEIKYKSTLLCDIDHLNLRLIIEYELNIILNISFHVSELNSNEP